MFAIINIPSDKFIIEFPKCILTGPPCCVHIIESIDKLVAFAAEVLAALVLWAWYRAVSMAASVRTFLIHLLTVSLETGLCGFVIPSYKGSESVGNNSLLLKYSSMQDFTHNCLSNG